MTEQEGNIKVNEAYGTYRDYGAKGIYEANKPYEAQRRTPLELKPFLPKKGNYRDLLVYLEKGGIHEQMTAAMGLIRPIRLIGLIGVLSLMACSAEQEMPEEPAVPETATAISFSGTEGTEEQVTRGAYRAYESYEAYKTNKTAGNTRAAQGLEDLLPDGKKFFKVWAYKNSGNDYEGLQTVMEDYTVRWVDRSAYTTTSNTNDWEYVNQQSAGSPEQTIKYWDWSATAYRFFGVTGGVTGTFGSYESYGAHSTYEITIPVDATSEKEAENTPYYSRLWFSTGNLAEYPTRQFGKPVQLEFLRPIARVRFMFIYEDPADEAYTVLAVKGFGPTTSGKRIYQVGTVKITYPLKGTQTTESYSVTPTDNGVEGLSDDGIPAFTQYYYETPNNVNARKWYSVLPAINQGTYTLDVKVNGNDKTTVVPAAYMNWKPGFQYTYVFKIHVDGSVSISAVNAAFTPWVVEDPRNHTVYNW